MVGMLRFNPHVQRSTPFSMADPIGVDRSRCLRLDRNESTRPVPPATAAAMSSHLLHHGVNWYPSDRRLTASISGYCAVPEDSVLPTNGSDQAIDITLRTFLFEGSRLLAATPEFFPFRRVAGLLGAQVDGVPYEADFGFPYAEFRAAVDRGPDLIVLINPNNPTGTPVQADFIREVLERCPDVPVVVDEAYYEFTGATVARLVESHPNLIVLRTFSKAFAMAGLRLGYIIADPRVLNEIRKLRNPFDVNELAAVAAEAQLSAVDEVRAHVSETMGVTKPTVVDFFRGLDVPVIPGAANFLLVRPEECALTVRLLQESGALVQPLHAPLIEGMFRLTIGTPSEMGEFTRIYSGVHRRVTAGSAPGGT
jgi:histidinol-phosphate aminotransferase